jgi:large subunit ribosomal protein L23
MVNVEQYLDIIQKPLLTEKSSHQQETRNQYSFKVHPKANKCEVRKAVEAIFEVEVTRVNIITMPSKLRRFLGRPGRTTPWKKALVTLKDGHAIDLT